MFVWIALILSLALNAYLIFHETMNKIQYVGWLRIYWITRDTGTEGQPLIERAWMRQTMAPYWRGSGVRINFRQYSFQFGVLTSKGRDLLDQLDGRELGESAKEIRQWK